MNNTEFICTKCPMGCMLNLDVAGDDIKVTGNACKIGERYGINEYTNPMRPIATSVICNSPKGMKMISVKTNDDVPKKLLKDCINEIKKVTLTDDNIKVGDVVLSNILDLGVDVVATRDY